MKIRLLPVLVAAVLSVGAAQASEPAKSAARSASKAPQTAEQKAARAEIDRLVERIRVLSRELGEGNDVRVIVHRAGEGGMRMKKPGHEGMDHDPMMLERMHGEGPRKIRIERMGPGGKHAPFAPGPGLGIVMAPNTAAAGVRIAAVTPDSPAQKAGLHAGDALLAINGKTISASGSQALANARELLGDLKKGQVVKLRYARQGKTFDASVAADDINRMMVFNRGEGMKRHHDGGMHKRMMMLPPGVETEILRVGPHKQCAKGDEDCGMPALVQAFRWQGLNLTSMDAGLGRYFGTDKGVLVTSAGPDLKGLQSGDVIQRVGGKAVDSPRDVMRALRDKDEGAQLQLDVLRDRKTQSVSITVPKSRPLPFMEPPTPPAAPPAPAAPPSARVPGAPGVAPPTPVAPPAPPSAIEFEFEVEEAQTAS